MWKNHKPTENVVVNELREETMVKLDEWRPVHICPVTPSGSPA